MRDARDHEERQGHNHGIRNRRVVVTGAAQGLGLAVAKRLAETGARVVLVDVDERVLEHPQDEGFQGRAVAIRKDLADIDAAEMIMARAVELCGPIDGLVNCAAWSLHAPFATVTSAQFDRLVAINQRAPFFLCQQFVAQLSEDVVDPCIVNIASVNAVIGNPDLAAYSSTKGALCAMTRALAVELAPRVRVVAISPGSIATPAAEDLVRDGVIQPEVHFAKYLIRRFIAPEEIAELVLILFGPAAVSLTGSNWIIDGGYTAQ